MTKSLQQHELFSTLQYLERKLDHSLHVEDMCMDINFKITMSNKNWKHAYTFRNFSIGVLEMHAIDKMFRGQGGIMLLSTILFGQRICLARVDYNSL